MMGLSSLEKNNQQLNILANEVIRNPSWFVPTLPRIHAVAMAAAAAAAAFTRDYTIPMVTVII